MKIVFDLIGAALTQVQCDQGKPECGQCLKRGNHCPGYRREIVFLNQNATTVTSKSSSKSPVAPPRDQTEAPPDDQTYGRATRMQPSRTAKPAPPNHARVNDQHVFKSLFAGEFLRIYLPSAKNCPQGPLTWLQLVLNVPTDGLVLEHAIAAVSLSVVGRATNNNTLIVEGYGKYGQALRALQRALWNQGIMYRDESLAACNTLVLYEVSLCT